jgi:hypothetical protein
VQVDYKKLFYSNPEAALTIPITLRSGYGVLPMGMALAVNLSAVTDGKYVPYTPTSFTGAEVDPGRAFLVADSGTSSNLLYITLDDSYKFAVGDDVIIDDNVTAAENLGKITAIDRTTDPSRAKITTTTNYGGTSFTVARKAHIKIEAGDSSNNYSDCVGILMKAVDTGTGVNAKGAVAQIVLSNALLYNGMLVNVDAAARTDISASVKGQYLLLK